MTLTLKVLGQVNVAANTDTTLYTVPAATQTVVSSIIVCNQNAAGKTFRVAVRPAGAGLSLEHYIYFNQAIQATNTFAIVLGITLGAGDVITVRANDTAISFNVYGQEKS